MPQPTALSEWVALAAITQPHGVSGRVKVKSFTDPERAFATYTEMTDAKGTPVKFRVTGEAQGLFIIEIEGVTRREQADLLRGRQLGVPRSQLPALEDDNLFYVTDLVGLRVVTVAGDAFGTVAEVNNYGAGDILDITRENGISELFAFTHTTFPNLALDEGVITINPPEMLGSRAEEEGDA
jgi:16S rRNA processing protein RimM